MISGKSVLAIIPAREGSKRVPLKNITLYRGLPLIQHAVLHAQGSKYIDWILISSDSPAILKYAIPPVIPLLRPPYLASDYAKSEAVIIHALYNLPPPQDSYTQTLPDIFVLLQPTSPNRLPSDIDACLELALKHGRARSFSTSSGLLNGAVYAASTQHFLATLDLGPSARYTMPDERSLDINTTEDFSK